MAGCWVGRKCHSAGLCAPLRALGIPSHLLGGQVAGEPLCVPIIPFLVAHYLGVFDTALAFEVVSWAVD